MKAYEDSCQVVYQRFEIKYAGSLLMIPAKIQLSEQFGGPQSDNSFSN